MLNRITPIYPEYIGLFPEAAELIERFRLSPDELKIGIIVRVLSSLIPREPEPEEKKPSEELDIDAVFAKLRQLGGKAGIDRSPDAQKAAARRKSNFLANGDKTWTD